LARWRRPRSDGFVVVAFSFAEVAGSEGGLGGFESALEKNGRIVADELLP